MRLIDAEAFLERMSRTDRFFGVVYDTNDAPTVDAVPVVRKHCDFCGRGRPIKAFTILPDIGMQYGPSIMATYCPNCGAKMGGEENAE